MGSTTPVLTRDALNSQIEQCLFDDLRPHIDREALIIVDFSLDLAATALLVIQDDAKKISQLIEQKRLIKPSLELVDQWKNKKVATRFDFLIASPYVLAKLLLQ